MLKRDIRIFINSDGPIEYTLEYFANSNDEKKFYGDVIFFVRNSNDLLCSFSKCKKKKKKTFFFFNLLYYWLIINYELIYIYNHFKFIIYYIIEHLLHQIYIYIYFFFFNNKALEKVRCFSKDCTYITLNFAEITDLITENKNLNRTIIENNKFVCGVYIQLYKDIECKDL